MDCTSEDLNCIRLVLGILDLGHLDFNFNVECKLICERVSLLDDGFVTLHVSGCHCHYKRKGVVMKNNT